MADRRIRRRKTPARDQLRIRNGLSIIPSLFTIGNIFCGYYALLAAYNADYDTAAKAIGFGVLLDGLDGRIARLTKTSSDFGVQLDSLADFLTFGAAPAMLAFRWAFAIKGIGGEVVLLALRFCSLTTFAFVVSGALRLARFNIQSQKPPDATAKRHFVGLPIPAGAGLIAAIVHFLKDPILQVGSSLLWSLLVLLAAILMISTVRYPSFKELNVMKYGARFVYLAAAMAIYLLFYYSEYVLLVLAVAYVSSGPIAKLVHVVRRFLAGAATAET
ncbi:MAG TPA: CDP-diacylglycerol--serine O-phosphatidyltransferase, partial [Terriglobia bacterium]|nr:CDP-diacylglycerol--serine O-phosphatidyltransferase [Terriglobia bacterium]